MDTVTLKKFLTLKDTDVVLIDLESCPIHMQMDYVIRNENVTKGKQLCEHCDGTGNEFMSMYHACPKCGGTGAAKE